MLFNKEKGNLKPLPKESIINDYLNRYKKVKVTNESLIRYKGKAYSVEPKYINCNLELQEEDNKLKIYYQKSLIETFNLEEYNKKINYKKEHYNQALSLAIGKGVSNADIEQRAIENLKNLDMLGGIVNEIQ